MTVQLYTVHDAQVERLSGLIARPTEEMGHDLRLSIINSGNNVEQRTVHLYNIIENDLLGRLQCSNNYIAPYKVRVRHGITFAPHLHTGGEHPAAHTDGSDPQRPRDGGSGGGRGPGGARVGTRPV